MFFLMVFGCSFHLCFFYLGCICSSRPAAGMCVCRQAYLPGMAVLAHRNISTTVWWLAMKSGAHIHVFFRIDSCSNQLQLYSVFSASMLALSRHCCVLGYRVIESLARLSTLVLSWLTNRDEDTACNLINLSVGSGGITMIETLFLKWPQIYLWHFWMRIISIIN